MTERSQIDEIKERLDIVSVAEGYLRSPFKKSGRNVFTICPFHNEKTPSFALNSDLGIFKCFGCGESGDVIQFIEKLEGVDFPQALEIAAEKAGVTLKKEFSLADKKSSEERKKLLELNNLVTDIYHYLLTKHSLGKRALDYCYDRKLTIKEIEKFKLGYAPKNYEILKKKLLEKGYKESELIKWGLLVSKGNRVYDKFRNRLMFPIMNHRGEIVGFSGRTLEKDGIPKYLNSPETPVFKKSHIVYGLNYAKDALRKDNFAIIAEGNFEPASSSKVGIDNVVVPLGTSLTIDQLKLIKRYCDTIYFALDTDTAGKKALLRAIRLANELDFNLKAINLGTYQDPDEMIRFEPNRWKEVVSSAVEIIEFLIQMFKKDVDLNSAVGKSKFVKQITPYLVSIRDQVQLEHYINEVANITATSKEVIQKALQRNGDIKLNNNSVIKEHKSLETLLNKEKFLVALALNFPNIKFDFEGVDLSADLKEILDNKKTLKEMRSSLQPEIQRVFDELVLIHIPKLDDDDKIIREFNRIKKEIIKSSIQSKMYNVEMKIKMLESQGQSIDSLLGEVEALTSVIKKDN